VSPLVHFLPLVRALPGDAAKLHRLDKSSNSDSWSVLQYQDAIATNYQVWFTHNKCAVIVWMKAIDETELLRFFVIPSYQGQGIGYHLLAHILETIKKSGITQMFLEVRISNAKAIRLYQRCGFVICGTRKNYYSTQTGGFENAWLMKKLL